jgi:hypothetical protein
MIRYRLETKAREDSYVTPRYTLKTDNKGVTLAQNGRQFW